MIAAALLSPATRLALVAAGIFFLVGLVTGVWKYLRIASSPTATAPVYVDIAHRAALLYSFAALLLGQFAALSAWSAPVNLWATAVPLVFFAAAILTYIVHGALGDTDNQLQKPHRVGRMPLPPGSVAAFMWLLVAGEIGGSAVLFAGLLRTLGYA